MPPLTENKNASPDSLPSGTSDTDTWNRLAVIAQLVEHFPAAFIADSDHTMADFFEGLQYIFANIKEPLLSELRQANQIELNELLPAELRPALFVAGRASTLNTIIIKKIIEFIASYHYLGTKPELLFAAGSYQDSHPTTDLDLTCIKMDGAYGVFDYDQLLVKVTANLEQQTPTVIVIEFPSLWGAVEFPRLTSFLVALSKLVKENNAEDLLHLHFDAARGLNGLAAAGSTRVAAVVQALATEKTLNLTIMGTFRKMIGQSADKNLSPTDKKVHRLEGGVVICSHAEVRELVNAELDNEEYQPSLPAVTSYLFLLTKGESEAQRMNELAAALHDVMAAIIVTTQQQYSDQPTPFYLSPELPRETNAVFVKMQPEFQTYLNEHSSWAGTVKPWRYASGVENHAQDDYVIVRFMIGYTSTRQDVVGIGQHLSDQVKAFMVQKDEK